jgi:hypothetical protein
MAWAPTSGDPLQTVARRSVVAAEEQERKRERATGAVRKIEGIMARNKVKVNDKGERCAQPGAVRSRGCSICCARCQPVVGRSARAHMPSQSGRK